MANLTKTDRRVQYTRQMLRQSLLKLLREKPVARVTVKELCDVADINRNTFYAHYASPADLLSQIEDELFREIRESVFRSLDEESRPDMLKEICHCLRANGDICFVLFSEYGDKAFLSRVIRMAYDRAIAEWSTREPRADNFQWRCDVAVNGSVAVIERWIGGGMAESPAEVAEFLSTVSEALFRKER